MNFKFRLVALLLVTMMMLSSCALSLETVVQYAPFLEGVLGTTTTTTAEPSTTTPDSTTPTEPSTTTPTEPTTTTKPATLFDPKDFDKKDYSTTRKELIARYTLTQEEVDATLALLDEMVAGAMPAPDGDPNVAVLTMEEWDALYVQFEESFYHIAQQMTIATIIYYTNMSDEEAIERHLNTQDMFYDIQDKYNQSLRDLYLNSPMKDELFEGWSEQDINDMLEYDPEIMEVKRQIDELQTQFDQLSDANSTFKNESVEIYKQILVLNNKLAKFNNYDNYYEYASKNVYGRDYSAEDLAIFRQYLVDYVVPSYSNVYNNFMEYKNLSDAKKEKFVSFVQDKFDKTDKNYLILYLNSLEGTMGENMRHVFENKNCVFSNNSKSHPTAFCTYLYEDEQPFCLFGCNGQSANTMVHEIGHYYASVTNNDLNNYDLCETHSQANEFLFIKFCEGQMNSAIYDCVRAYNLVNACYVMIIATIVDEFEQRVYALSDEEIAAMTSADFDAIMSDVCEPYGGADWVSSKIADPFNYWRQVAISNPVYYISYAVSAAASVEIFAMAEEDQEAAYVAYRTLAEGVTEEDGFLNALKKAGIYTPFEEEAFKLIRATMAK